MTQHVLKALIRFLLVHQHEKKGEYQNFINFTLLTFISFEQTYNTEFWELVGVRREKDDIKTKRKKIDMFDCFSAQMIPSFVLLALNSK